MAGPKTAMYNWDLQNDGFRFEWMQARQALCNVQLKRLNLLDPKFSNMFKLKPVDLKAMLKAFKEQLH